MRGGVDGEDDKRRTKGKGVGQREEGEGEAVRVGGRVEAGSII